MEKFVEKPPALIYASTIQNDPKAHRQERATIPRKLGPDKAQKCGTGRKGHQLTNRMKGQ